MSGWVNFRNRAEAFFGRAFTASIPVIEQAGLAAGKAVLAAHANGVDADSHAMFNVALDAIKAEAPHLEVTLSTALAAQLVSEHTQSLAQAADALPAPSAP